MLFSGTIILRCIYVILEGLILVFLCCEWQIISWFSGEVQARLLIPSV